MNIVVLLLAALIPLVIGFIWYNPKVFGTAWMKAADVTEEKMKGGNMIKIFSLTYLLSFFAAAALMAITIHQTHLYSIFADDPTVADTSSETGKLFAGLMAKYGSNFRTFKHGVFHGVLMSIMLVLPVIGINALFERKSFKYFALHAGYWIVSLGLMGGIVCQFIKL